MTEPHNRNLQASLVDALAEALHRAEDSRLHGRAEARQAEKVDFLEFLEGESVDAIKKMLGPYLAQHELAPEMQSVVDQALDPEHPAVLALLIPVLAALGWKIADAILVGPLSRLSTTSLRNFGDYKPDPMTAASGYARGVIDSGLAEAWKDDNGFTEVNMDDLVRVVRQSIGPEAGLALLQRDDIDLSRFLEILRRNNIDDESIADYLSLRWRPPSAAEAINAATQNQLTPDQVKAIMAQNGLSPDNYDWMFETNGLSPGVELLNKLKNYGLIDEALWEQGLLESPLKNKYIEVLKQSRFRRPPMEQTLTMVRRGVITPDKGKEYLAYNGYFPEDADALIAYASAGKAESSKELSAANLRAMYAEGLLSKEDAAARISALGFDADDTALMLDYADAVRDRSRRNTSISRVRSQYVQHKITNSVASAALDRLGVQPNTRDELLHDWQIEHEVTVRHLTVSDLTKAAKMKLLNSEEVEQRLVAMGYSPADASVIMDLHGIELPKNAQLKDLTVAQILKFMAEERLTEATARTRLTNKGYADDDVTLMIDSKLERNMPGAEEASTAETAGA